MGELLLKDRPEGCYVTVREFKLRVIRQTPGKETFYGSGVASPTIWSCYANITSLSLFISLEIDCFHGL